MAEDLPDELQRHARLHHPARRRVTQHVNGAAGVDPRALLCPLERPRDDAPALGGGVVVALAVHEDPGDDLRRVRLLLDRADTLLELTEYPLLTEGTWILIW